MVKSVNKDISPFIDDGGKIKQIPVSNKKKISVLMYLAEKFDVDKIYNEKQINTIINGWHTFEDYFLLRRLLVDYCFLNRTADGSKYWANKKNIINGYNK